MFVLDELEECLSAQDSNVFVRCYFFSDSTTAITRRYGMAENNVMVILG